MAATSTTTVNNALLSATLQRREKGYENAILNQIPLFYWLKDKGRYTPQDGGSRFEWAVEYALDTDEPSYQGRDTLNIRPQDNVTIATANWKQYFKTLTISGEEKAKNSGMKTFDLLQQKEQNALESLQSQMNDHCYADGTGNDSKQITGLAAIISETPTTGTLFGINRANEAWWRNRSVDTANTVLEPTTSLAPAPVVPNMLLGMEQLHIECGRLAAGGAKNRYPDLILCTENYFMWYGIQAVTTTVRHVNATAYNAGFQNVMFHGATMMHDSAMPDDAGDDEKAFFINSRFLKLFYHPQVNFKTTPMLPSELQDSFSARILWMGELICTNCAKQGVHQGITALV